MEERWWAELAGTHGIRRDGRSSCHQIPGNLKAVMVHCAARNRGTRPRFMRIKQQFLTREGRVRFRGLT
jgi:hypothetical protein